MGAVSLIDTIIEDSEKMQAVKVVKVSFSYFVLALEAEVTDAEQSAQASLGARCFLRIFSRSQV